MFSGLLPGYEPPLPPELDINPALVSAAYKRAVRLGLYWRLKPEERAILYLSRRVKKIKSPILKEIISRILSKVWPEKIKLHEAYKLGLQITERRIQAALKVGASKIVAFYRNLSPKLILQLGFTATNISPIYEWYVEDY